MERGGKTKIAYPVRQRRCPDGHDVRSEINCRRVTSPGARAYNLRAARGDRNRRRYLRRRSNVSKRRALPERARAHNINVKGLSDGGGGGKHTCSPTRRIPRRGRNTNSRTIQCAVIILYLRVNIMRAARDVIIFTRIPYAF